MNFRQLAEAMSFRSRLFNIAGMTFGGKRDLYKTLGYARELFPHDYRSRFRRNAVANRIVTALPNATWRGVEIVEDEDPSVETVFEAAFIDLDHRLGVWNVLKRADILSGIGRYAVILIGAPGELDQPLEQASADEIAYLTPYAEEDATIESFDVDRHSPRFARPVYYTIKRTSMQAGQAKNSATIARRVHYSRCIHVADGLLDDQIYGTPRLECVWNLLDDLEKVTGGGAEAFWRRADRGTQFDLDPTLKFEPEEKTKLRDQLEDYEHGFRRYLLTRGLKVNELGSDVADFKSPVESIIAQISAGTGIPQRVLMGSEQGKLAAKQDSANWDNRVTDRQNEYAEPRVVRPFVQRLIELQALPEPADGFDVRWSSVRSMDSEQKSKIAGEWAGLNASMGETVVTPNEIRERVLGLPPLSEALSEDPGSQILRGQGTPTIDPERAARARADEAVLNVLEAAIQKGNVDVIEQMLGLELPRREPTEVLESVRQMSLRSPDLAPEISALVAAVKVLAEKEVPTPIVNVKVDQPARKAVKRVIQRDDHGLMVGITEEENGA